MSPIASDDIASMPGRQLIAEVRLVLHDEDWRIRGSEEAIVAGGLRKRPDPEILSRADRFHALNQALDHAARDGPKSTIETFTKHLREAWRLATLRREIDASGEDDQPGDEAADPPPEAGRLQRA